MDIHIWYTLLSALVGGVIGARDRLGEVCFYFLFLFVDPSAINGFVICKMDYDSNICNCNADPFSRNAS